MRVIRTRKAGLMHTVNFTQAAAPQLAARLPDGMRIEWLSRKEIDRRVAKKQRHTEEKAHGDRRGRKRRHPAKQEIRT